MPDAIELNVGPNPWSLTVLPDRRVELHRAPSSRPTQAPDDLVRDALEHPHEFEAMRRAMTPDDHVAIVLDAALPQVAALLAPVLEHLQSAGVQLDSVTIITPPGSPQDWIDELHDEYADVRTEIHDPTDRRKLAYLATTSGGRRVYLNRTLVDADFVVVLSGRDYDPLTGYAGAETEIFPALSDEETRASVAGEFQMEAPGAEPWPIRAEASEILWLLGTPFLVQIIEGDGKVVDVVAGLPTSSAEGIRRQDARWRASVDEEPDTVVAAIGGPPQQTTFLDLAKSAACAARVVRKGGRIAILTAAAPELGAGALLLRSLEGPTGARRLLAKEKPDDWAACVLWAFAAKNHSLYLASAYTDDVAEELFATPIRTASEVQRLIDGGDKVLIIPDAHKSMVTFTRGKS